MNALKKLMVCGVAAVALATVGDAIAGPGQYRFGKAPVAGLGGANGPPGAYVRSGSVGYQGWSTYGPGPTMAVAGSPQTYQYRSAYRGTTQYQSGYQAVGTPTTTTVGSGCNCR